MVKLTGRQEEFLSKFLDLYRQSDGALHYTQVADHFGVSKVTAYDMLKLLEKRGLVRSEYVIPERESGPGRSTVVFHPTQKAHDLLNELAGNEWDAAEWEQVKRRILTALRSERHTDYQELLAEVVARIPEQDNPMLYAAEMITATILNLYQVMGSNATTSLKESLSGLGLPGEVGLIALGGLSFGLAYVEEANHHLTQRLIAYTSRYQDTLSQLSEDSLHLLSDLAEDIIGQIEMTGDSALHS